MMLARDAVMRWVMVCVCVCVQLKVRLLNMHFTMQRDRQTNLKSAAMYGVPGEGLVD